MLTHALHAGWFSGSLLLWGESVTALAPAGGGKNARTDARAGEAAPHPHAASAEELSRLMEALRLPDEARAAVSGAPRIATLMLPSHDGEPLPSPAIAHAAGHTFAEDATGPLVMRAFAVPAISVSAEHALTILDALDTDLDNALESRDAAFEPPAGVSGGTGQTGGVGRIAPGDDLRYFVVAGRFVRWLLANQRFVPALVQDLTGALHGLWQPWLADEFVAARLGLLLKAMPASARCASGDLRYEAWPVLEDFLVRTLGSACRRVMKLESMQDTIEGKSTEDLPVAWLSGLVREEGAVRVSPEQRPELLKRVRTWIGSLEEKGASSEWRLRIALTEPVDMTGLDGLGASSAGLTWPLSLSLVSMEAPDVVIAAEDVWLLAPGGAVVMGQRVDNPQELLLAELGRAARIYKPLEKALDESEPAGIRLTTMQAYEFLREHRAVLSEAGFAVTVPGWWDSPATRLGVRLQIDAGDAAPGAGAPGAVGPRIGLNSLVNYKWEISLGSTTLSLQEFEKLASMRSPLVLIGGRWVEVRPEDVQAAVKFIRENPGGAMELGKAMRLAYAADLRQTGLPVVGLDVGGWLGQVLGGDSASMPMLQPPATFIGSLRPYQVKGLSWMGFMDRIGLGACLADDMGLGKTIQFLALLLSERVEAEQATAGVAAGDSSGGQASKVGPTLLIVPMSVVGNWLRECKRFAPSLSVLVHHGATRAKGQALLDAALSHDLVVTTYALAHRDRDDLEPIPWHRVALDEAQNIKNPAAKQTQAIRSLEAPRRMALTGTPIENRLSELWSVMDFLNPGLLGGLGEFRTRFAVPIERYHDPARAKRLRSLVQPFVLRRLKTDPTVIADLPEKVETKEYCYLTPEQASLYESTVKQMLSAAEAAEGIARRGLILAGLVKLKQICNHPHQYLREADDHQGVSPTPARSGKCVRLIQMLEELIAAGGQALVFTQFRQMGGILASMLRQELGRDILFLHGGTTMKEREAIIAAFQKADGKCPVLILSLKAGGVGLNLTAANHVFHFDRWWNPAVENQATDRAFRIGQTRTVQVHKFVVSGTLEERIDQMIEQKTELAENVIGSGEAWLTELSIGQLRDVLALRPDVAVSDTDEAEEESA
jgi:SNF2 family DNA or RNA helicase